MALPNFYKKKLLLRNLPKNNVNSLNFLESGVIYYPLKKEYTLGSVVTCCALLKLITMKSASILRARKSSAVLKIRKGTPVGAKLTLRKKDLQLFYYRLLYQVLPQLNTFKVPSSLEKNKEFVVTIKITDIFLFPELRPFYFYLNKYNDLRLLLKINKSLAKIAPKFLFSLFEFPVKY